MNYPANPEIQFDGWQLASFSSLSAWHHRVKRLHHLEAACRCGRVTGFLGFRYERFNSLAFWFLESSSGNHTSDPQNAGTLHQEFLSLHSLLKPGLLLSESKRQLEILISWYQVPLVSTVKCHLGSLWPVCGGKFQVVSVALAAYSESKSWNLTGRLVV